LAGGWALIGSMQLDRRQFLKMAAITTGTLVAQTQAAPLRLKVGVTDWNLKETGKLSSVALAKRLGFDGVQVSLGRNQGASLLKDESLQESFIQESQNQELAICSTCLDILHENYLKNDSLGKQWVAKSIPITKKLRASVILLPFFGKGALRTSEEMNYVADYLKEIGPEAEKAGVILGLENTISAEDNARILDRAQSKAVRVYYDVGNSQRNGFDIYKEIPWLGKERICEIHIKDNPHLLGQGTIQFDKVIRAIAESGFDRWLVFETDSPSKSVEKDMTTNLRFIRDLLARTVA